MSSKHETNRDKAAALGIDPDALGSVFAHFPHWPDSFDMAEDCLTTLADYDPEQITDAESWIDDQAASIMGDESWLARNSSFIADYCDEYGPVTLTGEYPHTLEGLAADIESWKYRQCLRELFDLMPKSDNDN